MLLTILKYSGIIIAAISSVWGIKAEVTKEVRGRRVLTREGYISVLLTVFGFVVTIVSTIVEDYQNAIDQENAIQADIRKTNRIILSGQPLTSVKFRWDFNSVESHVLDIVRKGDSTARQDIMEEQGERGASQNGPWFRYHKLYPFINTLVSDTVGKTTRPFVMLISLDNNQHAVLPIGFLTDSTTMRGISIDATNQSMPVGVETESSIAAGFHGFGDAMNNHPGISARADTVTIGWDLNPYTFSNAVNKQISSINPTANLPDTLKIMLLFAFKELPFSSVNFSLSPRYSIWETDPDDSYLNESPANSIINNSLLKGSSIELTPNDLRGQTVYYNFVNAYVKNITDRDFGEAIPCKAVVLLYAPVNLK